ncbi:MAG TPA: TadE/TadG family type IV pilus assembly protein [Gemmataceae bacterium]|nr:TadE/TadG family type IV pilus assembly protein [Gemmataceae bacterium]
MASRRPPRRRRAGAASVELALLLPLLAFLFVIGFDYARIFYFTITVQNCARAGAVWASDPTAQADSPYANVTAAAQAEAPSLSPKPSVSSTSGTDTDGNPYVEVTVSYTFQTVTRYPGVPSSVNITRTVRTRTAPRLPS